MEKKKKFKFTITDIKAYNYVKCKISNDNADYRIMMIDAVNLKVMLDGARQGTWYTLDKIKPIPLTEKWLVKLEMEIPAKSKKFGKYIDTTAKILYSRNYENNGYQTEITGDVQYVHEFQNIILNP